VLGDRLVFFHRVGDEEIVDCVHRETGERFWRFGYPSRYADRYGYNDGPRVAPVIAGDSVYTLGAAARLHCIELSTGRCGGSGTSWPSSSSSRTSSAAAPSRSSRATS
jgi:hypothetical protein